MRLMMTSRERRSSWVALLGILCIALVLSTGILHVAHSHPNGRINPDCALCVTAHHAVQIVVAVTVMTATRAVTRHVAETFTPAPRQRFVLKLANRPPPVVSAFA